MCKFCDDIKKHKTLYVPVRTTYADDNICEVLCDDNCEDCYGCVEDNYHFALYRWTDMIWLGFHHQIKDTVMSKTSEGLQIKYCPWCGEKLTDEDVSFDKCCVEKLREIER